MLSTVLTELTQCSTAAVSYSSIDPVAPIWLWAHPQLERKDISLTNHEWFCFFNPSVGFETWRISAVMMLHHMDKKFWDEPEYRI